MSEVKTDSVVNVSGDNDSGIDLSTNDVVVIKTADTERLRVDASGNLGVGTTSPSELLHVDGTIRSGVGTAADPSIKVGDNNTGLYYIGSNVLGFTTDGTERMRIASSGTTSVAATTGNNVLQLSSKGSTTSTRFVRFNINGDVGTGTEVGSIQYNGTGTTYATSSDHRLKENVADMTGAIARVKQLAPKRFNFISNADMTVDGFIAHEAQTVVPEAITGTHNEVDNDGNPVMQGIDQSKLVPLLTGALKEAIAKIETLETQRADLEARLTALENA